MGKCDGSYVKEAVGNFKKGFREMKKKDTKKKDTKKKAQKPRK